MLQRFISWLKGVFKKMIHMGDAQKALKIDAAISTKMQQAIDLWGNMFQNQAPWLDTDTQSLDLPAAIAGEIGRLTVVEMASEVTGSPRADYLQGEYAVVLERLRTSVELSAAVGGLVFKPYVDGGHIAVDCVPAWRFLPTAFNGRREVTGAVFVELATRGSTYYTRMEHHELTDEGYIIRNVAYKSMSPGAIETPCDLKEVDEWAELEPETTIRCKNGSTLDKALFAYFRMPFANNIDPESPLGVSAYGRACGLIEEADKQYSRILWEFEGSELAVDASVGALRNVESDGTPAKLPARRKRLFRELGIDQGSGGDLYKVFSPAIRDSSLFNGLDKLLKRIEFNCYLSYGTLSDPQSVEKTAEEIKTSKQRSYSAVCDIQAALQKALTHLLWCMDQYATLYRLAPSGKYEVSFTWGDGVLEDTDTEFMRRKQLVDAGYLKREKLIAWYFGISEEDASEYIPEDSGIKIGE